MSLDIALTLDSIEVLENYFDRIRPDEKLRDKVDIAYKLENQSIIIYEIRRLFANPRQKVESAIAKTTFVKSKNHFKVLLHHLQQGTTASHPGH